ncbi:MAG: S-layer homology domain-containing protein [Candidatus Gastranaerophilales bacterium]|nr:S-layer homology domain-containing protein [Candidatus Gastranaerophilales bacterium]
MKKIFIKLVLGIFVSLLTFVPVLAVQVKLFPDVSPDYWAAAQIKELSEKGVIVGYPDGTFKPNNNVTRAEFASMAIWALGQEHTTVAQPVNFTDITPDFWAYEMIQRALYFELISCPPAGQPFRPDDPVSHAEAVSVAVNALTTETISLEKAKEVLKDYTDLASTPEWYLIAAGKAEILNMNVHVPNTPLALNANLPATRAEIAVLLKNMMEQAKLNPNRKLAEAMRKKTGDGFVIPQAFVQGSIGTLPAGSVVPIQLGAGISSQFSKCGEVYMAKAPQNYITRDKYILIYKDSNLQGKLIDVRPGKLFVRNGVLVLQNNIITTTNDQMVNFCAVGEVCKKKNWFIAFLRKIFKGEKLSVQPQGTVYVKLLQPLKIDLTNGWVIE